MEEEGTHRLLAGMDGAAFDYQPDSFQVYRRDVIQAALVAFPLIIVGAGIVGFTLYPKSRRKIV
jgi:hypothetical protein